MKRKIVALVALLWSFLLVLCSCGKTYQWEFSQDVAQVKAIQIVDNDYKVVKDIDVSLAQHIYDEVSKLEFRRYFPSLDEPYSKCGYMMLITYVNDVQDLIAEREPRHDGYIYDSPSYKTFDGHITFWWCEEQAFTEFIQHYMEF